MPYQVLKARIVVLLALSLGLMGAAGSVKLFLLDAGLTTASGLGVQAFCFPLSYLAVSRLANFRLSWKLLALGVVISSFCAGLLAAVMSPMVEANIKLFPRYALALFAIPATVVAILQLTARLGMRLSSRQSPTTGTRPESEASNLASAATPGSGSSRRVYLVGTKHDFHIPTATAAKQDIAAFCHELRRLAYEHKARAIAEEAPPDYVALIKLTETLPERVAQELDLRYVQLDLTEAERDELGIFDSTKAGMIASLEGKTEAWVSEQRARCLHVREAEWIKRLIGADVFPAIVICGANHIGTFSGKLDASGVGVTVSHANWSPSPAGPGS